ncbi:MAG: hypothetical protein KAR44_09835 [Candidatus Aegiribacteria sp.]|nr:hypothetical protein [Candidatus Aegiribacteria sp.]
MSDYENDLRSDSSNSLEFNEVNSIMVDEGLLFEVMQLAKQYDLEEELRKLKTLNEEKYRKQKDRLEEDDWPFSNNTQSSGVSIPRFSFSAKVSGFGGQKHRCLGAAWSVAAQSRSMISRYGSSYQPNTVAQQCMKQFPGARM